MNKNIETAIIGIMAGASVTLARLENFSQRPEGLKYHQIEELKGGLPAFSVASKSASNASNDFCTFEYKGNHCHLYKPDWQELS